LKRYHKLSNKQILLFTCLFAFTAGVMLLLFSYKQDEKNFNKLSTRLFREEMLAVRAKIPHLAPQINS